MAKICILYTGGTIGMLPTEKGYAPKRGYFGRALDAVPDLHKEGMPEWELVEFDPLLDSSNIALDQWNEIGRAVAERYDDFDGFVILHGTDTMAYTAAALSFMFVNLDKPVVLTGSQIPLCSLRSDATDNLITSMIIAGEGRVRQVCLYFGGKLIAGTRAVKLSADELVAFESPNYPCLARAGITIKYDTDAIARIGRRMRGAGETDGAFRIVPFSQTAIGVIRIFPGIQLSLFAPVMTEGLGGIVLETFGTGNIPDYDNELLPMIRRAFDAGTVVTVCSQCLRGTVHLGAYETSSSLLDAGAVSGCDMTTEAAVAKLYYLFSVTTDRAKIREYMEKNLRGELTEE